MVATAGGVAFALAPLAAACCLVVWLVSFAAFRYASVSSMVAAIALPVLCLAFGALVAHRRVHGRSPRWASSRCTGRTSGASSPAPSPGSRAPRRGDVDIVAGAHEDPVAGRSSEGRGRSCCGSRCAPLLVARRDGALVAAFASAAQAAPWCGSPTRRGSRGDRRPAGRFVCVYAYPVRRRRPDRRAVAPHQRRRRRDHRLVALPGSRARAAVRPRRVPVRSAGGHHDATTVRQRGALRPRQRALRADRDAAEASRGAPYAKQLVYYDGPTDDDQICGQGGGERRRVGRRDGVSRELHGRPDGGGRGSRAAARLRRARLERAAATPARTRATTPATASGHPLPVRRDGAAHVARPRRRAERLLRPLGRLARRAGLGAGCGSSTARSRSRSASPGSGSVESDLPGIDCAASCTTEWDAGTAVSLEALAGGGAAVRPLVGRAAAARSAATSRSRRGVGRARCSRPRALRARRLRQREGRGRRRRAASAASGAARVRRRRTLPLRLRATAAKGWQLRRLDRAPAAARRGRLHGADDEGDVGRAAASSGADGREPRRERRLRAAAARPSSSARSSPIVPEPLGDDVVVVDRLEVDAGARARSRRPRARDTRRGAP